MLVFASPQDFCSQPLPIPLFFWVLEVVPIICEIWPLTLTHSTRIFWAICRQLEQAWGCHVNEMCFVKKGCKLKVFKDQRTLDILLWCHVSKCEWVIVICCVHVWLFCVV
jgi:hypothetical protein